MSSTRILVLRFSAMGDVALVLPVVRSLVKTYPFVTVTVVTRPKFAALFEGIEGVEVFPADVDGEYRGFSGLWKLHQRLFELTPDLVIDLHDHLRTRLLRFFLKTRGIPVTVFDKGRKGKNNATGRSRSSHRSQLPQTTERYRLALASAGFPFDLMAGPHFMDGNPSQALKQFRFYDSGETGIIKIGIAPFSAHATKTWPLEQFAALMEHFRERTDIHFYLFGGGKKEIQALEKLEEARRITNIAGKISLAEELKLMTGLQAMVCVDSSNMHLAGLAGVPVVSIWGGTDPVTGFGPAQNPQNRTIAVPFHELECRPCSVYGKETCARGDFACLHRITTAQVATALTEILPPA